MRGGCKGSSKQHSNNAGPKLKVGLLMGWEVHCLVDCTATNRRTYTVPLSVT